MSGWTGVSDRATPLVRAGIVLGAGLGGFFDGIVIHQLLQWHHMLSSHPDPSVATDLRLNVFWDGLFHVGTYLFTVGGVALVVRAWRAPGVPPSGRTLLGATVAGWGVFNLVEGTVNHFLLGIHHVWPEGPGGVLVWDVLFLVWGAVFLAGGLAVIRTDSTVASDRRADETPETD
ncbi:DUF2243 domain-containing protein [Halorussus amylolyticus]|uniref:DUF2243 domain-containing protein n=1 Tax=Halorussus amylolyticus TaxID=1126242 RepID=UPI00104BBB5D|nr:DUF2243 domain-containing protein [Halorussus amylolyticus]